MNGGMGAIDAISWLTPTARTVPQAPWDAPQAPPSTAATGSTDFGAWFSSQIDAVNTKVNASQRQLQSLAVGDTENLHQVMLSLEEARLSLQLLAQVRTRLLESYQDLMRMQL